MFKIHFLGLLKLNNYVNIILCYVFVSSLARSLVFEYIEKDGNTPQSRQCIACNLVMNIVSNIQKQLSRVSNRPRR